MESFGATLKKIRLEKGITLEEIHRSTKIQLNILKAIEGDSFTDLSPVYLKGFLKIYCKFLGVDPEEYISKYKQTEEKLKDTTYSQEGIITPRPSRAAILLKSVSERLASLGSSRKVLSAFKIVLAIIIIWIALFNLGRFVSSKKQPGVSQQSVIKPEVLESMPSKATAGITSGIRLNIRANQNCWMLIKVDGKVVFQKILERGRYESWQAKEKIELTLGNAGAVELEVNGEVFDNLGRSGQVLKNVIITKEGLKINK